MQNDNLFMEMTPSIQDLDEILSWLKVEYDKNGEGFYCNRRIIVESFQNGTMITLKKGEKNIGFVIWSENDIFIDIDIFVINPDCRGEGYGRFFYDVISKYYRNNGFKAIRLFCEPRLSELFWTRMGLCKMPDIGYTQHDLTYYDILVQTAATSYSDCLYQIELWDVEPYMDEGISAKWRWYIEINSGLLLYPIIQPCNCDWKIKLSRGGNILKEGKVKYFTDENYEIYERPFLHIKNLDNYLL